MVSGDAPTLVHVVLISFRPAATPQQREQMLTEHQELGDRCGGRDAGILFWRVDRNLDQRKNWHLVEFGVFRDAAALERFRVHPAHVALSHILREIADWAVGDLPAALPLA